MRANTDLNECSRNCHVAELSWGEPIACDVPADVDVVLAADCVYFEVSSRSVRRGIWELEIWTQRPGHGRDMAGAR